MRGPLVIYDFATAASEFPYTWGKYDFLLNQCRVEGGLMFLPQPPPYSWSPFLKNPPPPKMKPCNICFGGGYRVGTQGRLATPWSADVTQKLSPSVPHVLHTVHSPPHPTRLPHPPPSHVCGEYIWKKGTPSGEGWGGGSQLKGV